MFPYYVNLIDPHFDVKKKLTMLEEVVVKLGGEDRFFSESNRIKETLINAIQATPSYATLSNDVLKAYETVNHVEHQDIYNMGNANRTYISVDLKHANFNVFRMYDETLTLGFKSYEDLVGSITPFDYFKKAKYLRQVIFGNMLPKKQQRLQKWVIDKIISVLHKEVGIQLTDFVSASSDEIVFAVAPDNIGQFVSMVGNKLAEDATTKPYADWIKVEAFTLKSIGDKKFFVKENLVSGKVEFKAVPSLYFMQVYKKYIGKELEPYDLYFVSDGYLAEFKETVFDNVEE